MSFQKKIRGEIVELHRDSCHIQTFGLFVLPAYTHSHTLTHKERARERYRHHLQAQHDQIHLTAIETGQGEACQMVSASPGTSETTHNTRNRCRCSTT